MALSTRIPSTSTTTPVGAVVPVGDGVVGGKVAPWRVESTKQTSREQSNASRTYNGQPHRSLPPSTRDVGVCTLQRPLYRVCHHPRPLPSRQCIVLRHSTASTWYHAGYRCGTCAGSRAGCLQHTFSGCRCCLQRAPRLCPAPPSIHPPPSSRTPHVPQRPLATSTPLLSRPRPLRFTTHSSSPKLHPLSFSLSNTRYIPTPSSRQRHPPP